MQNNNQFILKVRETATEAAPTTVVGPAPASSAALFMAAAVVTAAKPRDPDSNNGDEDE